MSARGGRWLTLALGLALVATLAWLSTRLVADFDWTAGQRNTLTPASESLARAITEPVRVTAYVRGGGFARRRIEDLVARYQRHSDHITLEFVDPDLDPERARAAGVDADGEVVIARGGRREHLLQPDERDFSGALQRLARAAGRRVVFVEGHGERDPFGEANHDYGAFGGRLRHQGIEVLALNPLAAGGIPANTGVLVVAGPQTDLLPGVAAAIADFIDDGGNLLWLGEPGPGRGLDAVADALGIAPAAEPLADRGPRLSGIPADWTVIERYPRHPVTNGLAYPTVLVGAAPLVVRDARAGWTTTTLLATRGGRTVAAALERGAQRAAVVGDGDFLANQFLNNRGNLEFGLNLVNWLAGDDAQIDIVLRSAPDLTLDLPRAAYHAIAFGFLLALPLALFGAGFAVWLRRRRR